jgi:hypothetical protein
MTRIKISLVVQFYEEKCIIDRRADKEDTNCSKTKDKKISWSFFIVEFVLMLSSREYS